MTIYCWFKFGPSLDIFFVYAWLGVDKPTLSLINRHRRRALACPPLDSSHKILCNWIIHLNMNLWWDHAPINISFMWYDSPVQLTSPFYTRHSCSSHRLFYSFNSIYFTTLSTMHVSPDHPNLFLLFPLSCEVIVTIIMSK